MCNHWYPSVCVQLVCKKTPWWRVTVAVLHKMSPWFLPSWLLEIYINNNGEKCTFFITKHLITECFVFQSHRKDPKYKDSPPEAIFVNVLGLLIAVFGALILWIATRPSWKRPSEQLLHPLHNNEPASLGTKTDTAMSEKPETEPNSEARRRNGKTEE